jgi:hypothetical protein
MAGSKVAGQKSFQLIQLWAELKHPKRQSEQVVLDAAQSNSAGEKNFSLWTYKSLCSFPKAGNWLNKGLFATI